MTQLTFFKDNGHYLGFCCRGHSGYAAAGEDIVCAAVSAAVQLSAEFLTRFCRDDTELVVNENSAEIILRCRVPLKDADKQLAVLAGFADSMAQQYPDYFNYEFTEV